MRSNYFESFLHVLMGFIFGLLGLHILLTIREFKQLPPENDKYPVVFIDPHDGPGITLPNTIEYWAKPRVMDTLYDTQEYVIGYTIAHIIIVIVLFSTLLQ